MLTRVNSFLLGRPDVAGGGSDLDPQKIENILELKNVMLRLKRNETSRFS